MKISTAIISICLTLFLLCGGCSREEPPPPPKTKIVKPIEKPAPEKSETEEERGKAKTEVIELMPLGILETDSRKTETAMEEVTSAYVFKGEISRYSSHGACYENLQSNHREAQCLG